MTLRTGFVTRILLAMGLAATAAAPAAAQETRPDVGALVRAAFSEAVQGDRQARQGREQTERTTRTLRIGANGELHVANISGDITVSRGGGNDVTIEIVKSARGRDDADARELLKLVQVEVVERKDRAEVKTRYPEWNEMRRNDRRNFNVSVAYNVTVPAGIRLRAASISGSIAVKDVKGEIWAESVSGAVRLSNGGRVASAKSISGDVEVIDSDIDGALAASTASGNVVMRRVKARQLDAGSISGDVLLDDVESPQVEAKSVSGDIQFGGPLGRSARYEMSSHSGDVTVILGGSPGFEVEATSFSGSIRSDFSFSGDREGSRGRGRGRSRNSLRGIHGDGSAVLELTTFSGSIVISKR